MSLLKSKRQRKMSNPSQSSDLKELLFLALAWEPILTRIEKTIQPCLSWKSDKGMSQAQPYTQLGARAFQEAELHEIVRRGIPSTEPRILTSYHLSKIIQPSKWTTQQAFRRLEITQQHVVTQCQACVKFRRLWISLPIGWSALGYQRRWETNKHSHYLASIQRLGGGARCLRTSIQTIRRQSTWMLIRRLL